MNAKRREYMIVVLSKRRILMRHWELQGTLDTTTYIILHDHNIQSTVQDMPTSSAPTSISIT
ncbi:hypothetical protein GmHk_20G059072 [Glycine max]|nr:hypothetical protein GmHk_20G059072 [Glycine max]